MLIEKDKLYQICLSSKLNSSKVIPQYKFLQTKGQTAITNYRIATLQKKHTADREGGVQDIRRIPSFCSWSTNKPPLIFFLFLAYFRVG